VSTHLGEQGIRRLREYGRSETSDDPASEGDDRRLCPSERVPLLLAHVPVDELVAVLVDRELAKGIGDLPARWRY
jgi:hypothetical protein